MKKLAVFLFALTALAVCAPAAPDSSAVANTVKSADAGTAGNPESAPVAKKPAPEKADNPAADAPAATEKKPSMLRRIFGRRPMTISKPENAGEPKPSPTPRGKARATPEPKATPAPKPEPKAIPEPKAKPSPSPKPTPKPKKPKATPVPKKEEASEPEPPKEAPPKTNEGEKEPPKPDTAQVPVVEEKGSPKPEASPVDTDLRERERFNAVRTRAMQDQGVRALKEKAEAAQSDDDLRKASKEFYKALYKKMRALDGSLKDRIDRMESAIMRRVDTAGEKDGQ